MALEHLQNPAKVEKIIHPGKYKKVSLTVGADGINKTLRINKPVSQHPSCCIPDLFSI